MKSDMDAVANRYFLMVLYCYKEKVGLNLSNITKEEDRLIMI